jgi:hypothetical protein
MNKNSHVLSKHVAVRLAKHLDQESNEKWQNRTLADYAYGALTDEEWKEPRLRGRLDYRNGSYPSHPYPNKQKQLRIGCLLKSYPPAMKYTGMLPRVATL